MATPIKAAAQGVISKIAVSKATKANPLATMLRNIPIDVKMLTIGHDYACPPVHAGGLRYHGMSPLISYLIHKGYCRSVAYDQKDVFETAKMLAQTEGMIAAPETAHSLKFVTDEALKCKKTGEQKVIAMNYSGHGLLDLSAYEQYLAGKLVEYEPQKIEVPTFGN